MVSVLGDIYSVLWVDLRFLRRHWLRTLATSIVSPILYLVAFGYGLGRGISFEGYSYLAFVMPGIIALTAMNSSYSGAGLKLHSALAWDAESALGDTAILISLFQA
jgi:ABC-2 type transport system permease protein